MGEQWDYELIKIATLKLPECPKSDAALRHCRKLKRRQYVTLNRVVPAKDALSDYL